MSFRDKVYSLTKRIPRGKVSTYGLIARKLKTKAFRAVGTALSHNPYAPKVPCHRIVKNNGLIGGFQGKLKGKSIKKKIKLLTKEGIKIKNNRIVDFEKRKFRF